MFDLRGKGRGRDGSTGGCGGEHPPTGVQTQVAGGGVLGVEIFTKMCKKTKVLLKNEGKIFRLRRATVIEQYDIWCI